MRAGLRAWFNACVALLLAETRMTRPTPTTRRHALQTLCALAGGSLLVASDPAAAQAGWPNRPIKLVLPSGPGGGADIFARPMAEYMAKELGQPVVVDNRPGANGLLAHDAVVRQPGDGYNLVISYAAAILGNKAMNKPMSHDPIADLKPIGIISGEGGNLLVVAPGLPVTDLKGLLALAKAQGGSLSYGSWGVGSGGHLVMEAICLQAGVRMNHVPYKTVAAIPNDLMAGVLQVSTIDSGTPVQLIKAGKLRAIAALSGRRLPQLPDVPTQGEQGFALESTPWYGLFSPASLPPELVNRLNALLNKWLELPDTKAFFAEKQNSPAPIPKSPEAFAAQIQRELVSWKKMVADAKV
jgi:tripartite-type tricarboxylate transporter receptor subunit TctC